MEKVKIKTVTPKESPKGKFWAVVTEDGRTGTCNNVQIADKQGQEIEVDVKPAKEYNGVQQYYFNIPNANGQGKNGFAGKNWAKENRVAALNAAVASLPHLITEKSSENTLKLADKYEAWLNR